MTNSTTPTQVVTEALNAWICSDLPGCPSQAVFILQRLRAAGFRIKADKRKNICTTVQIDSEIPIPSKAHGGARPQRKRYLIDWDNLKVGDSFYLPNNTSPTTAYKRGIKLRQKKEGDGHRFWRIA